MPQSPPNPDVQNPSPDAEASGGTGRFSHTQIGIAATMAIIGLAGAFWAITRPPELTPKQKLEQAIEWLGEDTAAKDRKAETFAAELRQIEYRDPDFPGGPEFVLGMVAYREAFRQDETNRQRLLEQSARWLEASESISLPEHHRPDWCYATGTALHHLGQPNRARVLLEEALAINPGAKNDIIRQLIDMSLESQSPRELKQALTLSDELLEDLANQADNHVALQSANLHKARLLLALGQPNSARELVDTIENIDQNWPARLVQIQVEIADANPQHCLRAKSKLQQIINTRLPNNTMTRQAYFLLGRCHELLGETQYATDIFEKTARQFPESQEGLAARVHAAGLLQAMKRHEEALLNYQAVLASIEDPSQFRNQWLNAESLRKRCLQSWNDWIDSQRFQEALSLSQTMIPLFSQSEALELKARATQQRAEAVEQEMLTLPFEQRESRQEILEDRWRDSGDAYAALADQLVTSSKYGDALWKSAEHYRKGQDYAATERMLRSFIATQSDRLLPLAYVWHGQALLCLDRAEEAIEHFSRVLEFHSTDPAAFEAAYWIGVSHLENGDIQLAEEAWRKVLNSSELTPEAEEWRMSLFQLGRLLYETAPLPSLQIAEDTPDANEEPAGTTRPIERLQEATRYLDEYLKRYPNSNEALEVQSHFANAHLRIASMRNRQLAATTIDAEQRTLQTEQQTHLEISKRLLTDLRQRLLSLKSDRGLNKLHSRLLRNCEFTRGEVEYELGEYAQAIDTLNRAINEYSTTARVLPAYLQIASAYDELGQANQARSVLQQAKVFLQRMPDEAFQITSTNFRSREEWMDWINWALQVRQRVSQN